MGGQGGNDASFNMCNDGGYVSNMANSYGDMVFTASLWGGGGIDMGWLDGMTGCGGECNIDSASVTMTNFELWEYLDNMDSVTFSTASLYMMTSMTSTTSI